MDCKGTHFFGITMRKAKPKKRILLPDPKFGDVSVTRFVTMR